MSVVDVTLENAPAVLVRRDGLCGRVHYFCSEYCEERDLAFLRQEKYDFDEATAKYIFRQVMMTIKALHDRKWYHQDIKLENIFVARDGDKFIFKIGDFGRLSIRHSEAAHEKGTLKCLGSTAASYFAPEAKRSRKEYYDGGPADVWAAGIVLLHLLLDAPQMLFLLAWSRPEFLRFLSPFHASERAMLRKRMAMNNYAHAAKAITPSRAGVTPRSRRSSLDASENAEQPAPSPAFDDEAHFHYFGCNVEPIHFADGSLELCSWLDNALFATDASHTDLYKIRHDTVEDVWFRGNPVPMRILRQSAVEREGFEAKGWYVIKNNTFEEAEGFVRRNTVQGDEVCTATVFFTDSGKTEKLTSPSRATSLPHQQARTILLRRTVRWLQWKPILHELENKFRQVEQTQGKQGLVRLLLLRLANPVYIEKIVDSPRPQIRGPRKKGKSKALKTEADMKELRRALRYKDPSAVMKNLKLHALDRPYVGARLNGGRGLDGKEAGKHGFITYVVVSCLLAEQCIKPCAFNTW